MKIIQFPNVPLIVAFVSSGLSMITVGVLGATSTAVYYIAIIIWAYEEVSHGVNWFRVGLGSFVAVYILYSLVTRFAH